LLKKNKIKIDKIDFLFYVALITYKNIY